MDKMRPQKIVNLLSAVLVLVAGFYIVIFMPVGLSPIARVIIGLLLIVYFMFRIRYYQRKYNQSDREI